MEQKARFNEDVDEEEHEELAVPEANTIVDPRAVMVHVEDAAIAGGTMMATLRLENVAHQTVTASFVLRITEMEAPEDGYLTWISRHALNERPDEEDEEHMEHSEESDDPPIVVFCCRK